MQVIPCADDINFVIFLYIKVYCIFSCATADDINFVIFLYIKVYCIFSCATADSFVLIRSGCAVQQLEL
jgi:hypothetical protein